jgi:hypothetical protein
LNHQWQTAHASSNNINSNAHGHVLPNCKITFEGW